MEHVAVYARLSRKKTKKRKEEETSIDRQVAGARKFAAEHPDWDLAESHIYTDNGKSGSLANRPGLQMVLATAKAREIQHLVIWSLDRLYRDARRSRETLHLLNDCGVTVWIFTTGQKIDLSTFQGRITTTMYEEFAEQYRRDIIEKTRFALRKMAEKGEPTGRPPIGYKNIETPDKEKVMVIDPEGAAVVLEVYERRAAGRGVHAITRHLNTIHALGRRWNDTTVRRMLKLRTYRLEKVWGASQMQDSLEKKRQVPVSADDWVRVQMPESLRIVPKELLARVDSVLAAESAAYQASRGTGRAPHKTHPGKYLCVGLLKCPDCGSNFEARNGSSWGGRGVYVCGSRRRRPGTCPNRLALPIAEMDAILLQLVEQEVFAPKFIEQLLAMVEDVPDQSERIMKEVERLREQITNLVRSVAKGMPADAIVPVVKEHEEEIGRLEAALRKPRLVPMNREQIRAAVEQRIANWREVLRGEPEVARVLLKKILGPVMLEEMMVDFSNEGTPDVPGNMEKYIDWVSVPGEVPAPSAKPPVVRWSAELRPGAELGLEVPLELLRRR